MGVPFHPSEKIWLDGKLVPWSEAQTHVLTHSLHYGVTVFEGLRAYKAKRGTAIFRLDAHVRRFFDSAKIYKLKIPFSEKEITDSIKLTVKHNKLDACYIRPIAFRGYGSIGPYAETGPSRVAIAAFKLGAYLGEGAIANGVKCKISSWLRIDSRAMPTRAKISGNYANSQLASEEARSIGFDEAILLNYDGFVSEGPGENIFIVKDGVLVTPPLSAGVLPGITRGSVLRLAKDHDIEVQERDITRSDLYTADEAFFSGTAAEITPIRNVDGIGIGDGKRPVTQKVQKLYSGATHGLLPKYREWLEYV